jgi:hypothetical protein
VHQARQAVQRDECLREPEIFSSIVGGPIFQINFEKEGERL